MRLDGADTHHQYLGDLLVGFPGRDHVQDLVLARCQRLGQAARGARRRWGRRLFQRLGWLSRRRDFVAFVPFPTAVLGEYSSSVATIFYALTMVVMGFASTLL